ncbi:MAG: hypothetical protein ACOZF0_18540 [Thermodesulfobacteriota bacterium]
MMIRQEKRKKFYQKQVALYKSIFSFFIFVGLGISLLTVFYSFFVTNVVKYLIDRYRIEAASGPMMLLGSLLGSQWFYIVLGGVLLIILATFFTHRFAGPLFRFEVSLERMINKDFTVQINLRKNDECKSLADKFNQFNSRMSSSLKTMRFLAEEIAKNNARLRNDLGGRAHDLLLETNDLNERLRKMITAFKLE